MSNTKVYVIHSPKPLNELKRILEQCGGYSYAGIIYKSVASRDGRGSRKEETKKTIVFCDEKTVQDLKTHYPEYENNVADYNWETFPVPNLDGGETWDLHVSGVPNDYTVAQAEEFVNNTLSIVLSSDNYRVSFATRLRETGEIIGYGHIIFNDGVPEERIRLCKLVLHNTPVGFRKNPSEKRMVTCVWHRKADAGIKRKVVRPVKAGFETVKRRTQVDVTVAPSVTANTAPAASQ